MNKPPSALALFSNPILCRYWRSRLRPVMLGFNIVITLVVAGFIATMAYLPLRHRGNFSAEDAARTAFLPVLIMQAIILMFLGTGGVGAGILQETEEGMIEYQRLTPLSPLTKVLGYLFGLPARQYVAFAVTAIFSAFSIIVGKIPLKAWGSVYLVLFTSAILYHLFALITGTIIKSRWRAGVIAIGFVVLLNFVLPYLAGAGFAVFSHLTIRPVILANFLELTPHWRGSFGGVPQFVSGADVLFFGFNIPHLAFSLIVQCSLILTFTVILMRRWRDEQAHALGKGYAVGFLVWVQVLFLGNVLPLLDRGSLISGTLRKRGVDAAVSDLMTRYEGRALGFTYGLISMLFLLPLISCITPSADTQMIAFRRRRKLAQPRVPPFSDGATAAPFAWIAAGFSGTAWALVMEKLLTVPAFHGTGFPSQGWAIFIGTMFIAGVLFHFLVETAGRRAAWFAVFLLGFVPLFISLVLVSVANGNADTAQYVVSLSVLSAPWQPIQWLNQITKGDGGKFGPLILFLVVHLCLCALLFTAWRKTRRARAAHA